MATATKWSPLMGMNRFQLPNPRWRITPAEVDDGIEDVNFYLKPGNIQDQRRTKIVAAKKQKDSDDELEDSDESGTAQSDSKADGSSEEDDDDDSDDSDDDSDDDDDSDEDSDEDDDSDDDDSDDDDSDDDDSDDDDSDDDDSDDDDSDDDDDDSDDDSDDSETEEGVSGETDEDDSDDDSSLNTDDDDEDDEDEDDVEAGQGAASAPKAQKTGFGGGQSRRPRASLDIQITSDVQQQEQDRIISRVSGRSLTSTISSILFRENEDVAMTESRFHSIEQITSDFTSRTFLPSLTENSNRETRPTSASIFPNIFGSAFLRR